MPILIRSVAHLDDDVAQLLQRAHEAYQSAAPMYDGTVAGAALLGEGGGVYVGSSGRVIGSDECCAEQVAIAAAQSAGESPLSVMAIVLDLAAATDPAPIPCGACRQLLFDAASYAERELLLYVSGPELGAVLLATSGELLPDCLGPLRREARSRTGAATQLAD